MKLRTPIAVLLLLALAAGCATSNVQRLAQANDLYAGTAKAIRQQYDAGRITPAGALAIRPYDRAARSALDAAGAVVSTDGPAFDAALSTAAKAIGELAGAKSANEVPAATRP